MIKNNFLTGLAILLPIAITFWVVAFLVNLLTNPFIGIVEGIFNYFNVVFINHKILVVFSRILILLFLFALALLAGFLARVMFINYFFRVGDVILHKIPFVNKIYKAVQDVIHTIFGSEKTSFSQVVLVPFPNSKGLSLGLVASDYMHADTSTQFLDKISIFVPGTPNPTMGFILLYNRNEVIYLDMGVDDALKFLVSCGIMLNDMKIQSKE